MGRQPAHTRIDAAESLKVESFNVGGREFRAPPIGVRAGSKQSMEKQEGVVTFDSGKAREAPGF